MKQISIKMSMISLAILALLSSCGDKKKEENSATVAPTTAPPELYQEVQVADFGTGPFTISPIEEGMSYALNYNTRDGEEINVLGSVVKDPTGLGLLTIEKMYSIGDKYVAVVSTAERMPDCKATTYAFTFDSRSESVVGATNIAGCSEKVYVVVEGDKLTIKKDGKESVIVSGEISK